MTVLYDTHGAPITESVHELEDHQTHAQTFEQPGESWCRCTCGEEMDSQASAGGPALSVGELFALHLEDVGADA